MLWEADAKKCKGGLIALEGTEYRRISSDRRRKEEGREHIMLNECSLSVSTVSSEHFMQILTSNPPSHFMS